MVIGVGFRVFRLFRCAACLNSPQIVAVRAQVVDDSHMKFGGFEGISGHGRETGGYIPSHRSFEYRPAADTSSIFRHPETKPDSSIKSAETAADTAARGKDSKDSTRQVKLTVGHPGSGRVRVETIKLSKTPRQIVISDSRGVQVGPGNRQFNKYSFELRRPQVSIESMLKGRPDRQRALANLAEKPNSVTANFYFRHTLSDKPIYRGERVRFADTRSQGLQRIAVRLDERGAIVVRNTSGFQHGDGNIQRNKFNYSFDRPQFSAERILRDSPDLARRLATALQHPDNTAARRSFTDHLSSAYLQSGGLIDSVNTVYRGGFRLSASGDGVQLGPGNTRKDDVRVSIKSMALTGWEQAKALGQRVDDPLGAQRLCEQHEARITMSRPPDFIAEGISQAPDAFLPQVVQQAATAALARTAPMRAYLAPRMASEIRAALDDVQQLGDRYTKIGAATALARSSRGGFGLLAAEPAEHDILKTGASRYEPSHSRNGASDLPSLDIVAVRDQELRPRRSEEVPARAHRPDLVPDVADSVGALSVSGLRGGSSNPVAEPAPAPPGDDGDEQSDSLATASSPKDPTREAFATGAVLCGSAAAIAVGRRILEADALLAYARRRIWEELYDGTPKSVIPALRALEALHVVLLLDPSIGGGLWVDVDPARQLPAASLLIVMDSSGGLPGRFRVFTQ